MVVGECVALKLLDNSMLIHYTMEDFKERRCSDKTIKINAQYQKEEKIMRL